MNKTILCVHCQQPQIVETVCDTCGENIDMADIKLIMPIKLNYFLTDYDFCGLNCLFQFISNELEKQQLGGA
jgi:hypothetical protein